MKHESQFVIARAKPEAASRLFCFPHAGGGPTVFFDWQGRLGEEIECVSIQYAGRGRRLKEAPVTSVEDLVAEVERNFGRWADKPFAFYGHSFGGIVAFELARQMRRSGLAGPNHLFVGAARAPHLDLQHPPLRDLENREFVEGVQNRYGGIPAVIYQDPDVLEMFLPAMRADFTAYETYQFKSDDPLDIPISAFAGADDKAVQLESVREWALHTTAGFDINVLPGGHFFPTTSGKELIRALQVRIAAHLNVENSTLVS